ncbi:hypothetical protein TPY_1950 [Sulfobacillus acidophilus TPY]|jgi:uncharacterized membrane protein|nr:hypothetical protein TPY_1950 [Sulfobacillus acidophilus TPY]
MGDAEEHPKKKTPWWQYIIYYNPDDPRVFVPRWGGWNVNIARPGGALFWLGVLIFFAVVIYVSNR